MRRPDLTVLAIPAFVGAMAAEYAWQRRHPAPPGTVRAGDYALADTMASLTMGVGSLVAPFVTTRLLDPVTPGVGRHARLLMGTAVATSAVTTVLDVVRRRKAHGGLPDAGTLPTGARPTPRTGSDAVPRPPDDTLLRRVDGAIAAAAVASTALTVATTWSAQTSGMRLFARSRRDLGTGWVAQCGRHPRLGRHLLLEPPPQPREPLAVGHARRAPLERALQPLDGPAPAGRGGPHDERAVRHPRPGRRAAERHRERPRAQPHLPVLDPHRGGAVDRLARERPQHPLAPPRAPRHEPAVPRPEPRQHPHRLGPGLRHVRARGRACRLRPDDEHRHLQPAPDRDPRVARRPPRRRRRHTWRERWSFFLRGPGWAYDRRAALLGHAS